ncbi:MAG: protein-L-isoaspartate(D-aspartate) O-methyltransferase [Acidobacteriaceae bacterium]|nr:protein-L-isoaspartate(D-aspartate) O-methyltransferase [Acidobacteriaceae bacterium]
MIETQIERRGVRDLRVLNAMQEVPRHAFVPAEVRAQAYEDAPLPIGGGQTISQPYMVAAMTAALKLRGDERVLEVGGGCGYQAAVLAKLAREVVTVEYRAELAAATSVRLSEMGYENIHVHCGDGTLGLPEMAPFDAIVVAAGAPTAPPPLLAQLANGGRLVIPIGTLENQDLQLIEYKGHTEPKWGGFHTTVLESCRFVPLMGAHGWKDLPLR